VFPAVSVGAFDTVFTVPTATTMVSPIAAVVVIAPEVVAAVELVFVLPCAVLAIAISHLSELC
jgi:hypothetical protein